MSKLHLRAFLARTAVTANSRITELAIKLRIYAAALTSVALGGQNHVGGVVIEDLRGMDWCFATAAEIGFQEAPQTARLLLCEEGQDVLSLDVVESVTLDSGGVLAGELARYNGRRRLFFLDNSRRLGGEQRDKIVECASVLVRKDSEDDDLSLLEEVLAS